MKDEAGRRKFGEFWAGMYIKSWEVYMPLLTPVDL